MWTLLKPLVPTNLYLLVSPFGIWLLNADAARKYYKVLALYYYNSFK